MSIEIDNQKSLEININPGQNILRPDLVDLAQDDVLPEGVVHISEARSFPGPDHVDPNYGKEKYVGKPEAVETEPAQHDGILRVIDPSSKRHQGGVTDSERTRLSDVTDAFMDIDTNTMGYGDQIRGWGNVGKIAARAAIDIVKPRRPETGWRDQILAEGQGESKIRPRMVKNREIRVEQVTSTSKVDFTRFSKSPIRPASKSVNSARTSEK